MNTPINQNTIGQKQQNTTMPIGPVAISQPGLAPSSGPSLGVGSVGEVKPSHAEIAARAFANYQNDGSTCGHCESNWLKAESQLMAAGQSKGQTSSKNVSAGRA